VNQPIPFINTCDGCSMAPICTARYTVERCNDPALYVAGGLHPLSKPTLVLAVPEEEHAAWSSFPPGVTTISVVDDLNTNLESYALSISPTLSVLAASEWTPAVGAFTFGRDERIEQAWRMRTNPMPNVGTPIIAPSFSTWLDVTPYEHAVQGVRTIELARILTRSNKIIPSIPLSPWIDNRFWAIAYGNAPDIAIDFGTLSEVLWERYMAILSRLAAHLAHSPRLIAYGVFSPTRIGDVARAWPGDIVFASKSPYVYAMRGQEIISPTLKSIHNWDYSKAELATLNDATFRQVVSGILASGLRRAADVAG
jgi:hypothetical protein